MTGTTPTRVVAILGAGGALGAAISAAWRPSRTRTWC